MNEGARSGIEKSYPGAPKSKALAISPRGHWWRCYGTQNQGEAARRALEACGETVGVPCMIIAVDDVFVVPIPTMMKAVGFFQTAANSLIAPGSRDDVVRRLAIGTSGWSAVATGANGLVGVVPDAGSERNAIEGALAACSKHDRGCKVIAIGPFSVEAADNALAAYRRAPQRTTSVYAWGIVNLVCSSSGGSVIKVPPFPSLEITKV